MIAAVLVFLILSFFGLGSYLAPLVVGILRQVPDLAALAVINVLLGWTFVGWVLALALALRSTSPTGPTVQIVQNVPPGGWPQLEVGYRPEQAPPLMLPPPFDPDDPSDWSDLR